MPRPQDLLLKLEYGFAAFSCDIDTYQGLVGEVQDFSLESFMEACNSLHHVADNIRSAAHGIRNSLSAMRRYCDSDGDKRRVELLELKLEGCRKKFEQAENTLRQYARTISDGLN